MTPNLPETDAALLDLTIIIPNYNTRELLRNCLHSIYQHTSGISFEVICLDDNSPDGSADMVAECFPHAILVRNKQNLYYTRNNNLGMKMSRARYACLLNSDTVILDNAFAALVRFMDEHPEAAACGPKLLNPDMTVQHCIRRFAGVGTFFLQTLNWHRLFPNSRRMDSYYSTDVDYSQAQQVESLGTTAYVLRRSTWEQAGMLDETYRWAMADLAYNFMLKQKGYKIFYTPCAEVVHYGSQSMNQMALTALREQRDALIDFNRRYDYFGKSRGDEGAGELRRPLPLLDQGGRLLRELRQASDQRSGRAQARRAVVATRRWKSQPDARYRVSFTLQLECAASKACAAFDVTRARPARTDG